MHEQAKLKEAAFFLSEMRARQDDRNAFNYLLSAFLSAARSVVQYAIKEMNLDQYASKGKKPIPGAQAWYDSKVNKNDNPDFAFFKEARDFNIHRKGIGPRRVIEVTAHSLITFVSSSDCSVTFRDNADNPESFESPQANPAEPKVDTVPEKTSEMVFQYEFFKRPDQNVLDLCGAYLDELGSFIDDAQARGFVTPES